MYDSIPGVLWRVTECQQQGTYARLGFRVYNDYVQRLYYEIALTGRAGAIPADAWISTRYYLDPGSESITLYKDLNGFTCGGPPAYSGLRRVRFGEDSGPYVGL